MKMWRILTLAIVLLTVSAPVIARVASWMAPATPTVLFALAPPAAVALLLVLLQVASDAQEPDPCWEARRRTGGSGLTTRTLLGTRVLPKVTTIVRPQNREIYRNFKG